MIRVFLLGAAAALAVVARPAPGDVKCESGVAVLTENAPTYSDLEVDVLAKPKRGNKPPEFPSVLRGSASYDASYKELVSGEVVARFVVDTLGCIDMRTFTVVSATDSAFTDELLQVLPKYRYDPARKEGQKVRAWLTWKFLYYKDNSARIPF